MAEVKSLEQIRQELAKLALDKQTDISQSSGVGTLNGNELQNFGEQKGEIKPSNFAQAAGSVESYTAPQRKPWVMTCQKWIEEATDRAAQDPPLPSYIYFRVNPSEVSWRLPIRATEKKTRSGTVLHVWRRSQLYSGRPSYFDEPQLTINFQSGNIMPLIIDKNGKPTVPEGLNNFYAFLSLMDEQKILDDGRTNVIYLIINTRVFPSMTLAGIFTPEGTSWSDSSDNPNQINNWTANFTIYSTYPALNDYKTMSDVFVESGFGRIQ